MDAEHLAVAGAGSVIDDVQVPKSVLGERRDGVDRPPTLSVLELAGAFLKLGDACPVVTEREDPALHEVGVEVCSVEFRIRPAKDVTTRDRLAHPKVVVEDGLDIVRWPGTPSTAWCLNCPLAKPPAKVLPAGTAVGDEIDLFPSALAHVADIEVSGEAVEARPPGIAQPIRVELRQDATTRHVPLRDPVVVSPACGVHVDPQ